MTSKLSNRDVATLLGNIATLLEIRGENRFKIIAYKRAAENIADLGIELRQLMKEGSLREVPGIGEAISAKIEEYLNTGRLAFYEDLISEVPESLLDLTELPEMGPKRTRSVWEHLGVIDLRSLEEAARKGSLKELEGFGPRIEEKVLGGIEKVKDKKIAGRIPLGEAWSVARDIMISLRGHKGLLKVSAAGSLRRMQETIGDIDILAASEDPSSLMSYFVSLPQVEEVLLQGRTKTSVRLSSGLQVDLRVMDPDRWGTAMQYFTGNQEHNVMMREWSIRKGFSLSEYSLRNISTDEEIFFDEEGSLYEFLGLEYIPPELRQGRDEIELASGGHLPFLVRLEDIRGDLQSHTDWSDGKASLEEMAHGAIKRGLEYLLITDHSHGLAVARGVSPEDLERQRERIEELNSGFNGSFRILRGVEVEVRADGTLDLGSSVLEKLDLVVAAVHSSLRQERQKITSRYLKALENPLVHILAHPTGRLINTRDEVDADWEAIFRKASERGVLLEINASPQRLDLPDRLIRRALEHGCQFVINTDSHSPDQFDFLEFGVGMARRGGLTTRDVANCWSLKELMKWREERISS